MPTIIENVESATSGVQFVIGQVANRISPQAKAITDLITGQPALLAAWADLVQKVDAGKAKWEDAIDVTLKLESLLSATALLTVTPGAQPAGAILGAVAASFFVWKQRDYILANKDLVFVPVDLLANGYITIESYLGLTQNSPIFHFVKIPTATQPSEPMGFAALAACNATAFPSSDCIYW